MNRAQRRAKAKATPAYRRNLTKEDTIKALIKNGITTDDLQRNYELGYAEGRNLAINYTIKACKAVYDARHEIHPVKVVRGAELRLRHFQSGIAPLPIPEQK